MKLQISLALVTAFGAAVVIASCGGDSNHGGLGGGGGNNNSNGPGVSSNVGGHGGGLIGSNGSSMGCETHCSGDLKDIVDCNDKLVMHCPAGKGCGSSGCVAPCESAKENKSSIGCDYYSVDPDSISEVAGACYAAYIANTWDTPVGITVERGGMAVDISHSVFIPSGSGQSITYAPLPGGMLPVGQVAIVFLSYSGGGSSSIACPASVTPATSFDPAVHGTGYGSAFHISTTAPVVAYDIFPYGGGPAAATSATLLLPTSAWDTNYIAVDAFLDSAFQPSLDVVAQEDATNVTILPTTAIAGGTGVPASAAGTPITYVVNKGQILQFTQTQELIGSVIKSDKPIGVWGGETCLQVPDGQVACDSAHQQIPPVKALGSEYVGVKYRDRYSGIVENPPWRIVGAVDGTTLTWDPAPPANAPTSLAVGQVAVFNSPGPFVVKSQDKDHPFYVSAHMEGCAQYCPDQFTFTDCRGDPEFVNVVPPDQYLDDYVFFTDPSYPETNLVLVRKKNKGAFADVTLDCAGTITGWQMLDATGNYQFARIDLVTGNYTGVNGCDNGRHEIKSTVPFGLTVWGWGSGATCTSGVDNCPFGSPQYTQAVSYAYPAGASVRPINTVVVPPTPK